MSSLPKLLEKLKNRQAVIGILGLGYVGLPLALRFAEVGYRVIGFDVDTHKIDKLNQGHSYIKHISSDKIQTFMGRTMQVTSDFSLAADVDALILCVPTPLNKFREPDLSYVLATMDAITPYLRKGQVISLESTTYPGTTDEELKPRIEARGLKVGHDVFLVFSPEREDPANSSYHTAIIPKVCGGDTEHCLKAGTALYEQVVVKVVPVTSTRVAEMTKLVENIHRSVNIGLMNELKQACDKMNINVFEVINAAATKPFGFVPYYPGPGIGGHCIPIDPFYLTWKAREFGIHTRFIELAGEINSAMPQWVVNKLMIALNDREKSLKGSRVLILGLAYKKGVDDCRESPSITLIDLLQEAGAKVCYADPHVPEFHYGHHNHKHYDLNAEPVTPENIASFDVVLLATAHEEFDYNMIQQHAKLIIDTRGVYHQSNYSNVIKA